MRCQKEPHQNQVEREPTQYVGDVGNMHSTFRKESVQLVDLGRLVKLDSIIGLKTGKNPFF